MNHVSIQLWNTCAPELPLDRGVKERREMQANDASSAVSSSRGKKRNFQVQIHHTSLARALNRWGCLTGRRKDQWQCEIGRQSARRQKGQPSMIPFDGRIPRTQSFFLSPTKKKTVKTQWVSCIHFPLSTYYSDEKENLATNVVRILLLFCAEWNPARAIT